MEREARSQRELQALQAANNKAAKHQESVLVKLCVLVKLRGRAPRPRSASWRGVAWNASRAGGLNASLQERPKKRPRGRKRRQETAQRRQDSAKRRQMSTKRCQDAPRSDFGAIRARFWTPRGGKYLDFRCNCRQKSRFSWFSKRLQKRYPKGSKRRPPGGENAPQERPGSAQERPKRRQDRPRSRQERPRRAPRAAQETKKRNKKGDHFRLRSSGGPGSPLGATLERFWSDLGAPGGAFSSHFRSILICLKRCVEPARARGVPSDTPPRR